MSTQQPILRLTGMTKHYPGVKALQQVDLNLYGGEVHALLGENGAGKSTLVKVMTGAVKADAGTIELNGQAIRPRSTSDAQKAGIATVYQEVNLVPNLSVAENLYLGIEPTRWGLIQTKQMADDARKLLARFDLDIDVTESLSSYSLAIQQLIAIARGLALQADVLVLDEPTASLDEAEVETLFAVLRQLREQGMAIVFITHFLDQVYAVTDRITVLRSGQKVGEYLTQELPREDLISAMLGKDLQQVTSAPKAQQSADEAVKDIVAELKNVSVKRGIQDITLDIGRGEAVGLAGLLGSGRSEVCRVLFGLDQPKQGQMVVGGQPSRFSKPHDAMQSGVALCPEDRKQDGIIAELSIRENILLAQQVQRGWWRLLPVAEQRQQAQHYIDRFAVATPSMEKPIGELSGGNQQKVILGRWLATKPQLLILDEPTRGIDIGAHAEIIRLIQELCDEGMALLVVSSELEELVTYAKRVIVMRDLHQVAELSGDELSADTIMHRIAEVAHNE